MRAMSLDERPEPSRMVRNTQVAELMHDHIVEDIERREYEPPVEGERAEWRARAPKRALPSYPDAAVPDADETTSRATVRASDSLTADGSRPSRGTWRIRCSTIHGRFSSSKRSTSARLVPRGTVSRGASHHGTSSRHRRARGDHRTSTSCNRNEPSRRLGRS